MRLIIVAAIIVCAMLLLAFVPPPPHPPPPVTATPTPAIVGTRRLPYTHAYYFPFVRGYVKVADGPGQPVKPTPTRDPRPTVTVPTPPTMRPSVTPRVYP